MKHIWLFLLIILPLSCNAEKTGCKYAVSFVEHTIPADKNIQNASWTKATDKDSDEYVAKLHLQYKNNNSAVAEHKYCDMYNFEYTYIFNNKSPALTKTDIAHLLVEGFLYSRLQPVFKTDLYHIIVNELEQQAFSASQSLSIGLPVDQVSYDDNVEYGIEYTPASEDSATASLMFYMSIGGE